MPREQYLTPDAIAEELGVSPDLVRKWIRNKELPALDLGKGYRILKEDYEEFKRKRRTIREEE